MKAPKFSFVAASFLFLTAASAEANYCVCQASGSDLFVGSYRLQHVNDKEILLGLFRDQASCEKDRATNPWCQKENGDNDEDYSVKENKQLENNEAEEQE